MITRSESGTLTRILQGKSRWGGSNLMICWRIERGIISKLRRINIRTFWIIRFGGRETRKWILEQWLGMKRSWIKVICIIIRRLSHKYRRWFPAFTICRLLVVLRLREGLRGRSMNRSRKGWLKMKQQLPNSNKACQLYQPYHKSILITQPLTQKMHMIWTGWDNKLLKVMALWGWMVWITCKPFKGPDP